MNIGPKAPIQNRILGFVIAVFVTGLAILGTAFLLKTILYP